MSAISKRTAIMIVHGIGEQMPYETLDGFARGFISSLHDTSHHTYKYYHLTRAVTDNNDSWCDSFVRISRICHNKDCDHKTRKDCEQRINHVDMHEYFWADATEQQIGLSEVGKWLNTTLKGAKSYVKDNEALQIRYAERTDGKAYTHKLSSLLKKAYWGYRMITPLIWLANRTKWTKALLEATRFAIAPVMKDYVGDVAIYTTTDRKSKFYGIRQRILSGAQRKLLELLRSEDYDQVILAGHSLGSVVSYDLLNSINLLCNHDEDLQQHVKQKLRALITFGSPLDKIAFFLRERAEKDEYVRRQIISNLHSFKSVPYDLSLKKDPAGAAWKMESSIQKFMDDIPWLNFYHDADPVSGHLDFYSNVTNEKACVFENEKSNRWGFAHLGYWEHKPMYTKIISEYLTA
jgi:hypothetical protein